MEKREKLRCICFAIANDCGFDAEDDKPVPDNPNKFQERCGTCGSGAHSKLAKKSHNQGLNLEPQDNCALSSGHYSPARCQLCHCGLALCICVIVGSCVQLGGTYVYSD